MPNVSIPRLAELERKEQELRDIKETQVIKPFCEDFAQSLATLAAYTPMSQWPNAFHVAFKHCADRAPIAAEIYRERNTKNHA